MAADHADALMTAANPMADLGDVYAWNSSDNTKTNLAMTVSPFDDGTREFGPSVQYVFHLTRYTEFPDSAAKIAAGEESKVVCTFASNTSGQCWVIDPSNNVLDYVEGDFSATTGKASNSGGIRVFAGPRSDPFFFNLAGFATAKAKIAKACDSPATPTTVEACPGALTAVDDAAGCPALVPATTTGPIAEDLSQQQNGQASPDPESVLPPGCSDTEKDCFNDKNVMALVVQVDKTLLATDEKPVLAVWASTHAGQ